ncbi:MAG: TIGR02391 family protein [Bacteroidetes bacterium]|nr:TIGR02391 family protein [Bacteroidota bacterium]
MKKKTKRITKKKKRITQKRRTSAKIIQDLRIFSEKIGNIIPATSQGDFSFYSIAKSKSLLKYWISSKPKKEQLSYFFIKLFRYHPNIFKKIIRENISQGIERRQKQGNPILKQELDTIDEILITLNINLSKEFEELNLPTEKPKIIPPSLDYQKMIDKIGLNPLIAEECIKKFKDGHLNDSVRDACEKFEHLVQMKSCNTQIGYKLMTTVFNEDSPLINITPCSNAREKSIQQGFKFLSMGAIDNIRNKFSHGDEPEISPLEAIELLCFVNYLIDSIP